MENGKIMYKTCKNSYLALCRIARHFLIFVGFSFIFIIPAKAEIIIFPIDLNEPLGQWAVGFYADSGSGKEDDKTIIPTIRCGYETGLSVVLLAAKVGQPSNNGGMIAEQKEPFYLDADIELGTTMAKSFETQQMAWNDNYVAYALTAQDSMEFYEKILESLNGGKEIYRFQLRGEIGNSSKPTVVYAPTVSPFNANFSSIARVKEVLNVACTEFY